MKKSLLISVWLMIVLCSQAFAQKKVDIWKSGMNIKYEIEESVLTFTMSAPTDGWVAIGLNTEDRLAGSSFLIGRVVNGKAEVVDFYTRKAGDVPKVQELGGKTAVSNISGVENQQGTSISFDLARFPDSKFHHQLTKGKTFYMHIAYSQEDDFDHHSMMRDKLQVIFKH